MERYEHEKHILAPALVILVVGFAGCCRFGRHDKSNPEKLHSVPYYYVVHIHVNCCLPNECYEVSNFTGFCIAYWQ